MVFALPEELPAGHFLACGSAHVWMSDEFPADVLPLWGLLLRRARSGGPLPLLCWPEAIERPLPLDQVEALPLPTALATAFDSLGAPPRSRTARNDTGVPFAHWPGMAPAVPPAPGDLTPGQASSRTLAWLLNVGLLGLEGCRLALVPVTRSSDAVALLGWSAGAPLPLLCALLRSWEQRYGARVIGALDKELHLSVARPPVDATHARLLALEHLLSTADNIVDDPPRTFDDYAGSLVGRTHWVFWWD